MYCEYGDRMDQLMPAPETYVPSSSSSIIVQWHGTKRKSNIPFLDIKNKPHHRLGKYAFILEHSANRNLPINWAVLGGNGRMHKYFI
jgi:hypothetical protein